MMLRNVNTGALQVYNISENQITNSASMGAVGLDWQFSGVGNFSSRGTSDMLLRNKDTGGLQVYDINSNAITGLLLHRQRRPGLRVLGRRQLQQRARRKRSLVAQPQHGRIASLQHR